MILWIFLTALIAIVSVLVSIPLIRRLDAPRSDRDRMIEVGRDQLAEIEVEVTRGVMSDSDAAEARIEVERRVLAVAKTAAPDLRASSGSERTLMLGILVGWIVLGGIGLYAVLGSPELAARFAAPAASPAAQADATATQGAETTGGGGMQSGAAAAGSVEEMIAGLAARLEQNPDDAEGWRMLGWSYFNTERYADAAAAYARAVKLDGSLPDVWSAYGETLVRSANGAVMPDALTAFDEALKLNPQDPRARFFKGMALEQAGNQAGAINAWLDILDTAPAGADWIPGLVQRVEELAAATNFDLGNRLDKVRQAAAAPAPDAAAAAPASPDLSLPSAGENPPGPTAADVAAAQQMTPQDQQAMILGMVEQLAAKLEANPDNPDGWVRLIRSRMVLNQPDEAAAALARAREVFASQPDKLNMVLAGARDAGLAVN